MDVALTNSIVNTATNLASAKTSDALNMVVLKKALDMQAVSAATMIDAMQPVSYTHLTLPTNREV